MDDVVKREVRKFRDLDELSESAAASIRTLAVQTVSRKGRFSIALSGGNTPRTLHHLLATRYRDEIPWESVLVFFGDERYVPHSDKQSNFLMARQTLLDMVPIPASNLFPIPTNLPEPELAAAAYEEELKKVFGDQGTSFDLLVLGMGKEGHTASLFPGSTALDESRRWTAAVEVPVLPPKRITLTYPVLNRSESVYFLVSGGDKSGALKEVLSESSGFHLYPAKGIAPPAGRVEFWVDSAALAG